MNLPRRWFLLMFLPLLVSCTEKPVEQPAAPVPSAFAFSISVTLPGTPETIYDAATGDISGWWDHKFSERPAKFYIDPKPGGGFYEIFDESGDGVLHATVIYAQRGKMLRFEGPLGLSGKAVQMVFTYTFEPAGDDSTTMVLNAAGSGAVEAGMAELVQKVWHHFLVERLKPYVESGAHLAKK